MNPVNRKEIANGVYFNSVHDSRFKTMKISANMVVPLRKETAAVNALLCGVLGHSCKEYPDFTALGKKLYSLYGATLSTEFRKLGDCQVVSISANGIDDRYALFGESVAYELSSLLCKVIFEPNIVNGAFTENDVEQERRQLLDLIDAEFNDKRTYANGKMFEAMCENEVYGIKRYGTREQVEMITSEELVRARERLLKTAVFEIMYVSDSPCDKAVSVFEKAFASVEREPEKLCTEVVRSAESVKREVEEMELSQSKLVMGFRTDCATGEPDENATRLMCAILGGTANSKLFCNVREKQSLCYYCASRFMSKKGIMIIDSGVEGDNIEKAEQGILKEIEDMKRGEITDFEIEAAKLAIETSLNASNDSVESIAAWYLDQMLGDTLLTVEQTAQLVNAVTKDEIVNAAKKLTLDTVYVLKNK